MGNKLPPDLDKLVKILHPLVAKDESKGDQLTILGRERISSGTFPKEIVTCQLSNGNTINFFCKYSSGHEHNDYGHRGGLYREKKIYDKLLNSIPLPTPKLYGNYFDETNDEVWLILEFIENSVRVSKAINSVSMVEAAKWIAHFHSKTAQKISQLSWLSTYDLEYFTGWTRRLFKQYHELISDNNWLNPLSDYFYRLIPQLTTTHQSVIHGEYYSKNILFSNGIIYPIDWESAAVSSGIIDLASLVEGWPDKIKSLCIDNYKNITPWLNSNKIDFDRVFLAAQLYLHFRWLARGSDGKIVEWRLNELYNLGKTHKVI